MTPLAPFKRRKNQLTHPIISRSKTRWLLGFEMPKVINTKAHAKINLYSIWNSGKRFKTRLFRFEAKSQSKIKKGKKRKIGLFCLNSSVLKRNH
jgi:hypothetical protein